MATPIRQLLKPKLLSPLSPIIGATNKSVGTYGTSPLQKNVCRARNSRKILNFQRSPNNLAPNLAPLQNNIYKLDGNNVKIKVTDYTKESMVINTPNKNILMKDGLKSSRNLEFLGKGSFGTVVRGIYKGADVAVKIVKVNKNKSSPLKESNAVSLNHENVIKIVDIIHSKDASYGIVVMEYLKFSRHLQSILEDECVNINQQVVVKYALHVCKGLLYCHQNEVLHLDVKPSNILVCEDGLCKLCDFGNSFKLGSNDYSSTYQATVAYAAPELLMGKRLTSKCDVYSLGIVLWQMRYREIPYSEIDGVEVVIYKVVKFSYRPKSLSTFIEDEYYSIYSSCWSANPIDRPDISSVIQVLRNLV